jgi:heat shock protein HtpX
MSAPARKSPEGFSDTYPWKRTVTIDIAVPPDQLSKLLDYLINTLEHNPDLSKLSNSSIEGGALLQYRLNSIDGSSLDVAVQFLDKIYVYYSPYPENSASEKDLRALDMQFETLVRSYFAEQSKASLFLVFSPKMNIIPGAKERGIRKFLASLIFGNMLYFFIITLMIGILVYQFFLNYTPLVLVLASFVLVLSAPKLLAARGEFDITSDNPSIHIAELRMKRNEFDQVMRTCFPKIMDVKKRIYDSTLAVGKDLDQSTIINSMNEYGAVCTPEAVNIKRVDVYRLVKDLASKFGFGEPRITLLNVLPPNAAATGISPKHATVLVTSGLIAQMEEDEIKTVLAHEFSHVKARDPLVLLSLATLEYLMRVYVLWPFFAQFGIIVDLLYLVFSLTLLFFVAKFLEARADLDAALVTGMPKLLAASLRKLGLWKFHSSVFEIVNVGEWLKWDPHPPLYYRIRTLEKLDLSKVRHTYLTAIKGCLNGFINSFKGK